MDYLPGVTNEGGAGNEGPGMNVESTSYYTINGTEAQNTEYTVDGMPNNAVPWYLMNTPSVIPSADALQEFKVTTSPYDAEAGRTSAGVVSMELKSGTNNLHGSAYEFANAATWTPIVGPTTTLDIPPPRILKTSMVLKSMALCIFRTYTTDATKPSSCLILSISSRYSLIFKHMTFPMRPGCREIFLISSTIRAR
jgi:hypothetical protein